MHRKVEALPVIKMVDIVKRFPGVVALSGVNLSVDAGEVHALVGENGAGKSTLVKILSGAYQKDEGHIEMAGKEVIISSPEDAMALGIGIIYQDLNLVGSLTVAENIFLGRFPLKGKTRLIDWKELFQSAETVLKELQVTISPRQILGDLTVGERQMVAIAKALSQQPKVLVMDEPTAALSETEIQSLFTVVRRLQTKGVGIIFISHHLEEVFELASQATVLRDGQYIGTVNVKDVNRDQLIQMMVGRKVETLFPKVKAEIGPPVLELEDISWGKRIKNVSLTVRQGEIVGLTGLVGAGRTELAQIIFGDHHPDAGKIKLRQKEVDFRLPKQAVEAGISLIPEDRAEQGLHVGMTVRENTTIATLKKFVKWGRINRKKEMEVTEESIKSLNIKTSGTEQRILNLSGGNQQKVALAKWMQGKPELIIFDEPTRGIDVGAKAEIYRLMCDLAQQGVGVLMISSELPEVMAMSDRILVMCEGCLTGEFDQAEATPEKVMLAATGGK
ncbi:MAG TPA: sugar ABC transporter ATP-binding protein [Bacillota bacterium]|nr:sugar ABC transporter ATP-binding protein [Bacillota bacterium]